MGHHGLPFLRTFPRYFGDRTNVSLPFLCLLFEQITFGFIITDITAKITCACANLKPMMRAKQLSCFDIVQMHEKNDFRGIRVIPQSRAAMFKTIPIYRTYPVPQNRQFAWDLWHQDTLLSGIWSAEGLQ